jgi:hypothetical protein
MLGSGKTGPVRAFVTARSARSQDADLYRRYAAALCRQALLTRGDPASSSAAAVEEGSQVRTPAADRQRARRPQG